VNRVVDEISLDPLLKKYKGDGSSGYHPRMLLKVLVYGYLCNIYSSRKVSIEFGLLALDHNMKKWTA
jgi:transposase